MTPDPLQPEPEKARKLEVVTTLSIPVELNDAVPHGTILLVAQDDKIERIIARHLATVDAFTTGDAPGLKVVVYDPRVGAPPLPMIGAQL